MLPIDSGTLDTRVVPLRRRLFSEVASDALGDSDMEWPADLPLMDPADNLLSRIGSRSMTGLEHRQLIPCRIPRRAGRTCRCARV